MRMRRKWRGGVLVSLIFSLLLSGCGSGGDGQFITPDQSEVVIPPPEVPGPQTPPSPLVGVWTGTASNGRTFWGHVTKGGWFRFVYSEVGNPSVFRGGIQGQLVVNGTGFESGQGINYSIDEQRIVDIEINGTFVAKSSASGTMRFTTGEWVTFTWLYDARLSESPRDISKVWGSYSGTDGAVIPLPGKVDVLRMESRPLDGYVWISGLFDHWFDTNPPNPNLWQWVGCVNLSGEIADPADFWIEDLRTPVGHVYAFALAGCQMSIYQVYHGIAIFDPRTNTLTLFGSNNRWTGEFAHYANTKAFIYRGQKS